ncbi:zinc finger FYVE domain-containing protein 1-like isoform X2 [Teleopsis dalmanni]|uniref:zinc finger FYVE domain-containing protein 1-like isoform X2 n=1 Tax=Teleopsis dalmanni TaxID=139649 RepID=UPI0018CF6AC9|nr:zinc finger FYVE domain-containing protein 1-like isoform X2 [Teleopsis dalmanni]
MAFLREISEDEALKPDIVHDAEFKSIPFIPNLTSDEYEIQPQLNGDCSFLLMDASENLHIATPDMFSRKLHCSENDKIKVVSIFGNTGDGKSYTLNHTFFHGQNIFQTSPEQNSCTVGVFAAMQHELGVLCLDTEGLLGTSEKSNRRMRMLLKILAISDIVIYRTRSERLHSDMFEFLGTASKAFCTHFAQALQSLAIPGTAKTLGPAIIVFHETRHTKPLESSVEESAEDKLRENFSKLNYDINAFSSLRYVGIQTENNKTTDFSKVIAAVRMEIENTSVRSSRQPGVVFKAMKALNVKFSGEIIEKSINPFPEQYFTCPVHCESCNQRCQRSMGHVIDGENHFNKHPCNYQHQYENKVYLCKTCYINGKEIIVTIRTQAQNDSSWYGLAKYAWKGPVIECPHCGEIYRARQYWYGNKSPETTAVRSEIVHVWKGGNITTKGPVHSAQMVLDGVSYISEAISCISAPPTKAITGWLADKVAPSYWKPNHEIINCHACRKNFEKTGLPKHHCRGCGEGFCHPCSQHKMSVPARGWLQPVRVCNDCKHELQRKEDSAPEISSEPLIHNNSNHNNITGPPLTDETDIRVRKYGESIYNTITSVASVALDYPKEIIKDSARPSYWVPDAESPHCHICRIIFGTVEELEIAKENGLLTTTANRQNVTNNTSKVIGDCKRHHCRRCGQAVCADCSQTRCPVPERGWQTDVRVCDSCACIESDNDDKKSKKD